VALGDSIQEFDGVLTPFLLSDGRLVVPIQGQSVLRVFSPDGALQTTLGRYGQGPGEFEILVGAWARGDTIEASDWGQLRIVRFLPDGSTQEVSLEGGPFNQQGAVPGTVGDGWAVGAIPTFSWGGRDQWVASRFDRSGAYMGEMAQVEGMLRQRTDDGAGPNPLSPVARFRVHGGALYVAETLDPSIRVYELGADSARVIRWDPGRPPAVDAAMRAAIDRAVASAPADRAESQGKMMESYPLPDRVSVFWDFLVDDLGFVWVRPFELGKTGLYIMAQTRGALPSPGTGGDWLILSPEGVRVGTVSLPADLEPMQITRDAVVGIVRDELGVEYVRVHRVERR
jgi:hypothetical protein